MNLTIPPPFDLADDMVGLPDHVFLAKETGKPREGILRKSIGIMGRQHGLQTLDLAKRSKKQPKVKFTKGRLKLVDLYCWTGFRRGSYISEYMELREELYEGNGSKITTSLSPSWELGVFFRYRPEAFTQPEPRSKWHLHFDGCGVVPKKSSVMSMVESRLGSKRVKESQRILDHIMEPFFLASYMGHSCLEQLDDWDHLSEEERQQLAEVCLASATAAKGTFFSYCLKQQPGLAPYFSALLSHPGNHPGTPKQYSRKKKVPAKSTPTTELEYLDAMESLVKEARDHRGSLQIAEEMVHLVHDWSDLIQEQSRQDPADIIIEWCITLYLLNHRLEHPLFGAPGEETRDVWFGLLNAWQEYFHSENLESLEPDGLRTILKSIRAKAKKTSKTIRKTRKERDRVHSEIAQRENTAPATVMEQRKQDLADRQKTARIQDALYCSENQGLFSIFPPGCDMDQFESYAADATSPWDEKALADPAATALRSVNGDLDSHHLTREPEVALRDALLQTLKTRPLDTPTPPDDGKESHESGKTADREGPAPDSPPPPVPRKKKTSTLNKKKPIDPRSLVKPVRPLPTDPDPPPPQPDPDEPDTPSLPADETLHSVVDACRKALNEQAFIPGDLANDALSTIVDNGRIEIASDFSFLLKDMQVSSDCLPYRLFKSAYYGANTWDNREAFNKTRRLLDQMTSAHIEKWTEQANAEMVPYLIFSACFQPTIFGGNTSTAPMLLRGLPDHVFDGNTHALIRETIDLANHGETTTLKALRISEPDSSTGFDITALDQWGQRIREGRRGHVAVLKAQSYCLEKGIFHEIDRIIRESDRKSIHRVEEYIQQYADEESSRQLLDESLQQIAFHGSENITKTAYLRFYHHVSELADICRDWLASVVHHEGNYTEEYAKRLRTRLKSSIDHFNAMAKDDTQQPGRKAGARLVSGNLCRLSEAIDRNDSVIWPYKRIKGWYYYPRQVMEMENCDTDHNRLEWHFSQIEKPFDAPPVLETALQRKNIRLAELLRLHLRDQDPDSPLPDVHTVFQHLTRNFEKRCHQLQNQLENAQLSELIDAGKEEFYRAELEDNLEMIGTLKPLDDSQSIHNSLDEMEAMLQGLTASTREDLRRRYQDTLGKLQNSVSDDAVPESWIADMEKAFKDDNLPVVQEMLDELESAAKKRRRIEPASVKDIPMLKDFIAASDAIFQGIHPQGEPVNRNRIWTTITGGGQKYGLEFPSPTDHLKPLIETLCDWCHSSPPTAVNKTFYERVVGILQFIGLVPAQPRFSTALKPSLNYQTTTGFSTMVMRVKASPSTRPFALFGSSIGERSLPVIIAYRPWNPDQLDDVLISHKIYQESLLISAVPLTDEQRNKFAGFCKRQHKTVLHIDLVTSLFLAAQPQDGAENIAVRNFLWLAAPYTYFNPYDGTDASNPPLPEMRYGREIQIDSLLKMDNGSAIVFGGRQLGKSTILQEVRQRFHRPAGKKYAFYEMLDKDLYQRIDISQDAWQKARRLIWDSLYRWMCDEKLVGTPIKNPSTEKIIDTVKKALISNRDSQIIAIFDEIDPILGVDSAHDFNIFRELRDLVAHPEVHGRFKIIIGGLENVKRLENSPNYPLTQLGGSIQVSIMPTQEALHLITEPLRAVGYTFESVHAANRILAVTNRHPGLIQIFCHELIKSLSGNMRTKIGNGIITDNDVTNVGRNTNVMDLIRKRFDMTLNLDQRYQVIVYGIINEGRGAQAFSSRYAKETAECWLPEDFSHLSVRQFEAFLVELVGLGVLRLMPDGRYALRNTSVLKLLTDGQGSDVSFQLEQAIEYRNRYDPLDRHSFDPRKDAAPSPVTYRDEKAILGSIEESEPSGPVQKLQPKRYTTSIIVGSDAAGLNKVAETLPGLYEEEERLIPGHYTQSVYQSHRASTEQYNNPNIFEKKLLTNMVTKRALKAPQMVFITVESHTPLANFLGMLDAAHRIAGDEYTAKYPLRIVFLMGPSAYWNWLSRPDLTAERENLQPFIRLAPWTTGAVRAFLEKLQINDSLTVTNTAIDITDGWYSLLEDMVKHKKQYQKWSNLSRPSKRFPPVTELPRKETEKLLKSTGALDREWVLPLLKMIHAEPPPVELDMIRLLAEDSRLMDGTADSVDKMLQWLCDLNLLKRIRSREGDRSTSFELLPSVHRALYLHDGDQ